MHRDEGSASAISRRSSRARSSLDNGSRDGMRKRRQKPDEVVFGGGDEGFAVAPEPYRWALLRLGVAALRIGVASQFRSPSLVGWVALNACPCLKPLAAPVTGGGLSFQANPALPWPRVRSILEFIASVLASCMDSETIRSAPRLASLSPDQESMLRALSANSRTMSSMSGFGASGLMKSGPPPALHPPPPSGFPSDRAYRQRPAEITGDGLPHHVGLFRRHGRLARHGVERAIKGGCPCRRVRYRSHQLKIVAEVASARSGDRLLATCFCP